MFKSDPSAAHCLTFTVTFSLRLIVFFISAQRKTQVRLYIAALLQRNMVTSDDGKHFPVACVTGTVQPSDSPLGSQPSQAPPTHVAAVRCQHVVLQVNSEASLHSTHMSPSNTRSSSLFMRYRAADRHQKQRPRPETRFFSH